MVETLITGGHLLTMAGDGVGFVEDGAVAIDGGKIVAVGPRAEVEAQAGQAANVIDATDRLVMPGLVDAHTHSSAVLARGWAQEVATWMASAMGPLGRHVPAEYRKLGTMVALMEGVANGTTTFGDYVSPMNELIESHVEMGNRAVVCESISELNWDKRAEWLAAGWKPGDPTPLDPEKGEQTLSSSLGVFDNWDGYDNGRINVILGPHAADFLSKEMLLRVQDEARKRGTLMHLHVAQDPRENEATLQRYGLRAIPFLDSIGLLDSDLIAVHLSTTTPDEVELRRQAWRADDLLLELDRHHRRRRSTGLGVQAAGWAGWPRLGPGAGEQLAQRLQRDAGDGDVRQDQGRESAAAARLAGAADGDDRGRDGARDRRSGRQSGGWQGSRRHHARSDAATDGAGPVAASPEPRPEPGLCRNGKQRRPQHGVRQDHLSGRRVHEHRPACRHQRTQGRVATARRRCCR